MTHRARSTKSKRDSRRGHHAISAAQVQNNSDGLSLRHMMSLDTGKYKGRGILDIKEKISKKERSKGSEESHNEKKTTEVASAPQLDLSIDRSKK